MASLFRVLAAKPYTSALRRSFAALAAKTTSQGPDAVSSSSSNDQPPLFETLRGVIDGNTLKSIKHTHMSPVQAQIFPLLPELVMPYNPDTPLSMDHPRDLLVKAKTGTGKTMGFLLPAIEARLKAIEAHTQSTVGGVAIEVTPRLKAQAVYNYAVERVGALIVSPTRELATQIAVEATNLTAKHFGFQVRVLLGGESKNRQIREWEGRKDIVVCTPGRILDLLESFPPFSQAMKYTQMLILDEADTLLEMGFRDDIESIKSYLPQTPERQTLLFSATVSPAIRQVAISTLSSSYRFIDCVSKDDSPVHDHIPQYHTVVSDPSQTFSHLLHVITHDQLTTGNKSKIIVFFATTKLVQLFSDFIQEAGPKLLPSGRRTKVYEMHSKRDMDRRMAVSKQFRADTSGASILMTSDVSARGVDYPGVTRVIQMGVPANGDMYIHRVGRTGRGDNKTGRGDLILSSWEMGFIKKQLRTVPLKPLTLSDLQEENKELATSKDAETAGPRNEPVSVYSNRLEGIESTCQAIAKRVGEEAAHDVFMSQIGFYLGRYSDMGLNKEDTVLGLQTWTQELFGLEKPPTIPYSAQLRLGLLNDSNSSRGVSRGVSHRPYKPQRPHWEGRGNRSANAAKEWAPRSSSGSSYGQRSGGYGSSSYGSRDSGDYTPRASYGSRDSNSSAPRTSYGSRNSSSSYSPRGSQFPRTSSYGSRDSNSYGSGGSKYGSRDSESYGSGGSKYGSRDSKGYGSGGSKYGSRDSKGYGSGASKYGSRDNSSNGYGGGSRSPTFDD